MDYKFESDKFEFDADTGRMTRAIYWLRYKLFSLLAITAFTPPVQLKESSDVKNRVPTLDVLGDALGFYDPPSQKLLSFHGSRVQRRGNSIIVLYLVIGLPATILFVLSMRFILRPLTEAQGDAGTYQAMLSQYFFSLPLYVRGTLAILLFYLTLIMIIKIASILTDRYYAESLCAATNIYLLIELSRDDALFRPGARKQLLHRLNDLARNTLLLSSRFIIANKGKQEWVNDHFKQMEAYIRERQRWVLVPTEESLRELRRDFYRLALIYINCNYGCFSWVEQIYKTEVTPRTRLRQLVSSLLRFAGIIVPPLIMVYLIRQKAILDFLNINPSIVAFMIVAWLLLAIDATLKLGIVERVVGVAKQIKELK